MSDMIKRDKQLRLLAQLHATIKRDSRVATPAMAKVWSRQLQADFDAFKSAHSAVIDRTGQSEVEEQHAEYDDANTYFLQTSFLVEELLADRKNPTADAEVQMRVRQVVATKRLTSTCERIAATVADMQLCELEIERTGLDAAYAMLQHTVMDRIAAGANDDEVLGEEAVVAERYRVVSRQLANARAAHDTAVAAAAAAAAVAALPYAPAGMEMLKLPHLQIAPFDGQFTKWEAFRESFEHGVHARVNMAGVQKLQFLKSVLRGEPEELIQNFSLTNENYAVAWQLLNARYNNELELVSCHLRILTTLVTCSECADDLRRMANKVTSSMLALRNLGRPVEQWDDWVVFHVGEALDRETRRMWMHLIANNDALPTWAELDAFLQKRVRALASDAVVATPAHSAHDMPADTVRMHVNTTRRARRTNKTEKRACAHCGERHHITCCDMFRNLSVPERRRAVAEKALCFVCLAPGHRADACKATQLCEHCGAKHNSLLHVINGNGSVIKPAAAQLARVHTDAMAEETAQRWANVFLPTAMVNVRDVDGGLHKMRALLDQGSEASSVSERAAQILQLTRQRENVRVEGIGGVSAVQSTESVVMEVSDQHGMGFVAKVNALVMPRVAGQATQASGEHSARCWPHVQDLLMADPDFMQRHTFDILLGSEVVGTLLRPGLRQCAGLPTAQNTMLGWIVSGATSSSQATAGVVSTHYTTIVVQTEEETTVRRRTADEEKCERNDDNRKHARLQKNHGESWRFAVQRQRRIERKFNINLVFTVQADGTARTMANVAVDYMREAIGTRADMRREYMKQAATSRECYIDHQAGNDKASSTTNSIDVFDAIRRITDGVSLINLMMVSPRRRTTLMASGGQAQRDWAPTRGGVLADSLWKRELKWDDALPVELAQAWRARALCLRCDASLTAHAAMRIVRVLVANQQDRIGQDWCRDAASVWQHPRSADVGAEEARTMANRRAREMLRQLGERQAIEFSHARDVFVLMMEYDDETPTCEYDAWMADQQERLGPGWPREAASAWQLHPSAAETKREVRTVNCRTRQAELRQLGELKVLESHARDICVGLAAFPDELRGEHFTNASDIGRTPASNQSRNQVSALLIRDAHEQASHGGLDVMLAILRRRAWWMDEATAARCGQCNGSYKRQWCRGIRLRGIELSLDACCAKGGRMFNRNCVLTK